MLRVLQCCTFELHYFSDCGLLFLLKYASHTLHLSLLTRVVIKLPPRPPHTPSSTTDAVHFIYYARHTQSFVLIRQLFLSQGPCFRFLKVHFNLFIYLTTLFQRLWLCSMK
jgi:hypothetical protein